ncbi:hypothetical protein [Hymenobacter coalescens]
MIRPVCLLLSGILLSSCSFYRWHLGSFYPIKAKSKALTEQAIISLIQDGTFQTRIGTWRPLIEQKAALLGGQVVGHWVDTTYVTGYRNRKGFVVFHPPTHTFYSFELCNCGGPVSEPEGLIGPDCDLRITSMNVLQPDSALQSIEWRDAGPALTEFKRNILPAIRKRADKLGTKSS